MHNTFWEKKDYLKLMQEMNMLSLELHECAEVNFTCSGVNTFAFNRIFAVYSTDGNSYLQKGVGGPITPMRAGCIYFISSAEELVCHFEKGTYFFSFHFDAIAPSGRELFFQAGLLQEEEGCEAWIAEVKEILSNPEDQTAVIRLKSLLLQKIVRYLPRRSRLPDDTPLLERDLFSYLRNEANAQTTIADLAAIAHVSPDTLSRYFSKRNNITIKRYLDHSIAARASQMLRDSSLKIKDIAKKLKFRNEYYFSRFYKRETSQTPSEFRRNFEIKR